MNVSDAYCKNSAHGSAEILTFSAPSVLLSPLDNLCQGSTASVNIFKLFFFIYLLIVLFWCYLFDIEKGLISQESHPIHSHTLLQVTDSQIPHHLQVSHLQLQRVELSALKNSMTFSTTQSNLLHLSREK